MSRLSGVEAKVRRAKTDINEARGAIKGFLDAKPYELEAKLNPQLTEVGVVVRLQQELATDDIAVSLGLGVHGLRSALDQIAWALTVQHQGFAPRNPDHRHCRWQSVSFPVFSDPGWGTGPPAGCRGIAPRVWPTINAVQPRPAGKDAKGIGGLRLLHELWVWDKHKAPSLVLAPLTYESSEYGIAKSALTALLGEQAVSDYGVSPIQIHLGRFLGKLEDGDEVFRFATTDGYRGMAGLKDYVHHHYNFAVDVKFDNGPPGYSLPAIEAIDQIEVESLEAISALGKFVGPGRKGGYPLRDCPRPCRW